ncbi:uncharacterized protein LOC144119265 [Amblyomma americanum]
MEGQAIWCKWLLFCSVISLAKCCESNAMDALFVSTAIGRVTNHFIKNCSKIMLKIKPYPPASLVGKFVRSTCEAIDICQKLVRSDDFQDIIPCLHGWLWAHWLGTDVVPLADMKLAEETMLCGARPVTSARVARHVLAYFLKVVG